MLKAYFDESGIHNGSPICVVAGFVLSSQRARLLSDKWQSNLLYQWRIPYFHAKEFSQRTGPFKGWRDVQVRDFSIAAIAIINEAFSIVDVGVSIGAALVAKDFFALTTDERRWLTGGQYVLSRNADQKKWKKQGVPTKPYFLLFQHAVLDAVKLTADRTYQGDVLDTGDMVHFIFDQQKEYEVSARSVFRAMKQMPLSIRNRIGDVVFSSKLRATPLQVADFMAYESYCYLRDRELSGKDVISRQAGRLLSRWDRRYVFINEPILKGLLYHCPMAPHKIFVPPDPVGQRLL